MNLLIAIAIIFFVAGIGPNALLRKHEKYSPNVMLDIISYSFMVVCLVIGVWFSLAGALRVVEVDLRGKTTAQLKTAYKEMEDKSNEIDARRKAEERAFFRSVLGW